MEYIQVLKYAYRGALEVWAKEYDRLQELPDNEITQARFERCDRELNEIRELLLAEEQKNSVVKKF